MADLVLVRSMKRSTFYKIALGAAALGAAVGLVLFGAWKVFNVVDTHVWTWLYPSSLMFMAADGASVGGQVAIVVLSLATNACLYFIVASILCGLVAGFRHGVHD